MLRRVFKAFEYRDFRLLWFGACTSSIGNWMQEVAQSWLVLEITKSPFLLGLDAFLGDIPIFLFSLLGGVIADRMDRRRLLLFSQYTQMATAFILAGLIATKTVQVWHILTLSFIVGTAQAFGGPAYAALVPSLVEKKDLPNAIALNSIQFNVARVIGPVLAGLAFTHFGAAWCFALNGASFIAVIISLMKLHIEFKPAATSDSIFAGIKQGVGFIRSQGAMQSLVGLAFLMTGLAVPMITFLPVFAKNIFQGGPATYTLLLAASGLGSITGALIIAAVGNARRKGLFALLMLMVLGAAMTGFALSHNIYLSCILLYISGASMMGAFAMISSLVQLITANEMRGRVMSVYNVAFRGGMPMGNLLSGRLIPVFTAPLVVAANGVLLACLGLYFLIFRRRVSEL